MAFDDKTRNKLARLVGDARKLLVTEFTEQLQELYGIQPDGDMADLSSLTHLDDEQLATAARLRERIDHLASGFAGEKKPVVAGIDRALREQAFTILNRFAALRMCEERGLLQECVASGTNSKGFKVYLQVAGSGLGGTYHRYRTFIFVLFDELAVDLGVLFDRYSPFGLLFPREQALYRLLEVLNQEDLKHIWAEDETIGWVYQYFNPPEERKDMRKASSAPRNSRELAVRNQFFTPRYVVEFLSDNTLGRIWYEMTKGQTRLKDLCRYLVRRPTEIFLAEGQTPPNQQPGTKNEELSQEELLRQPVHIPHRPLKDPRAIRMLDPACGSMHFGLYCFDIYEVIYEEAWDIEERDGPQALLREPGMASLHDTFSSKEDFLREVPRLIIEHNIHGIDIDPRCAQIAGLSLWLRAQRSWQKQDLKPTDRPRITRSNIVCAEPMPGNKALLREFTATLPHKAIGQLVEMIFDKMQLAGEAGSLLKIEDEIKGAVAEAKGQWKAAPKAEQGLLFSEAARPKQGELQIDTSGITDEVFWEKAEDNIYKALAQYAETAQNGHSFARRLFAQDAARGFAFIDICRTRYDVALMNPPYGEAAQNVEEYLRKNYDNGANDIFMPFIERASQLCTLGSIAGALTSRNFMFNQRMTGFRRVFLLSDTGMELLADLGNNVLDAAVDVAAFTLRNADAGEANQRDIACFNLVNLPDRAERLHESVSNLWSGQPCAKTFLRPTSFFLGLPDFRISYSAPDSMVNLFIRLKKLVPTHGRVLKGLITGDDERFVRSWPECPHVESSRWRWFHKGGDYSPFYADVDLVVSWGSSGSELKADAARKYGSASRTIKNEECFGRPGLGWGVNNSVGFAVKAIPANCVFADIGPVFQPGRIAETFAWSGYLNSTPVKMILRLFQSGDRGRFMWIANIVEQLPCPMPDAIADCSGPASEITRIFQRWTVLDENSPLFGTFLNGGSPSSEELSAIGNRLRRDLDVDAAAIATLGREIDGIVERGLVLHFEDAGSIRALITEDERSEISFRRRFLATDSDLTRGVLSYALGSAFGRWDIRYATGEKPAPALPDPFAPLPACPPGMLQNEQALPASPSEAPMNYPLRVSWPGILVGDTGHLEDIERRIRDVLESIWGNRADVIEREACAILGATSMCDYLRRPTGFFTDHLKRYSKSRRQAPIYWPLSTASGSYTLWIYYHRLTDQTLFTCLKDFVDPKLAGVVKDIARLRTELQSDAGGKRQEELESLVDLEQELREFRDELLRLTKLPYKPDLNDGVMISACPLWRLFRLPKWQKDLKACWEALADGDYDWAHLAYAIWPDRVTEKCKTDRSLAIAHGLEHLCTVEPPKPKKGRKKKGKKDDEAAQMEMMDEE